MSIGAVGKWIRFLNLLIDTIIILFISFALLLLLVILSVVLKLNINGDASFIATADIILFFTFLPITLYSKQLLRKP